MSKRSQILQIRLDQLNTEKNVLDNRTYRLYSRKKNEQKLMLESYFTIPNKKFACNANDTSARLVLADDKYGGLVEYVLDYQWVRDENGDRVTESKLYHNGTTIRDLDESVIEKAQARLDFMQVAIDFNDDIIAHWNTIERKYDRLIDSFSKAKDELMTAIHSQERDIANLEQEALTELLTTKGVEFVKSNGGRLPSLEVRWDWDVSRIKKLKVTRFTPSGKSADIEVVVGSSRWDDKKDGYVDFDEKRTFESVRFDKIKKLIRYERANNRIVS